MKLCTLALYALVALGQSPRVRSFELEYSATMPSLPDVADVWVPLPVDDSYQTITGLRYETPRAARLAVVNGNTILHTKVRGGETIRLRYMVQRRERIQPLAASAVSAPGPSCCLGPDRLVPLDAQIRRWANEVVTAAAAKTDLEKARAIYNHVVATVKYDKTGKGWGRGDIYYACDARRGNCTDFHAIFIGYSRAVGIPARFAIGIPLPAQRGTGEIAGYHCWAEFYAKGIGWVPIDASEAAKDPARREYYFGAHDENRVELSRGRDVVLAPRQKGDPLNFFVYPYAESQGTAIDGIRTTIRFRESNVAR